MLNKIKICISVFEAVHLEQQPLNIFNQEMHFTLLHRTLISWVCVPETKFLETNSRLTVSNVLMFFCFILFPFTNTMPYYNSLFPNTNHDPLN